jgi:YHS domain-containing protein
MTEQPASQSAQAGHQIKEPAKTEEHSGHEMNASAPTNEQEKTKPPQLKNPSEGEYEGHDMGNMKMEKEEKILDPICGMDAIVDDQHSFTYKGKKYYFCSTEDLAKFKQDPEKYAGPKHQP